MKNTFARVFAAIFASLMLFAACSRASTATDVAASDDDGTTTTTQPAHLNRTPGAGGKPNVEAPDSETPTELRVIDLTEGPGEEAVDGSTVEVHYVGVLHSDGSEFDSSWDQGQTFSFTIGSGQVIAGWDQGVVGMKAGGQRQLDIPADLAYGESGAGPIGPGEALTFVIDLVSVAAPNPNALTELTVTDIKVGEGPGIVAGDVVSVDYRGFTLEDNREFDNSYDRGEPITFPVGQGLVIPGWDKGLLGMKVGGEHELLIPSDMAYGSRGQPVAGIAANADLIFQVELVAINPPEE